MIRRRFVVVLNQLVIIRHISEKDVNQVENGLLRKQFEHHEFNSFFLWLSLARHGDSVYVECFWVFLPVWVLKYFILTDMVNFV